MGKTRFGIVIAMSVLLALLVGCKSNTADESMNTGMDTSAAPATEAPAMQPAEPAQMPEPEKPKRPEMRDGMLWEPDAMSAADMVQVESKFYFDFDQAIVKRAGFAALARHAAFLASNPGATVRLEGHADERGTREYNLALGERRANAVSAYLRAQGVAANQIEVISYGEEKPAALGHDEASWAKNRRVELIYR